MTQAGGREAAAALLDLIQSARGERPSSLACGEAEDVLDMVLALLIEVSVASDRIDRLERVVAELGGQTLEALRETAYDGEVAQQRQAATEALLLRVLRILVDPRTVLMGVVRGEDEAIRTPKPT